MFGELTALGWGLVVFALIIGIGSIVLSEFGDSVTGTEAENNTDYLLGQLGEEGLAGWTPAVIAIFVGLMFVGAMTFGKKRNY